MRGCAVVLAAEPVGMRAEAAGARATDTRSINRNGSSVRTDSTELAPSSEVNSREIRM